jgi:cysteine desulfurase
VSGDVSGYLDAATAAPLHPAARAALEVALDDGWADPRRLYGEGRRARQLLDAARASIAASLGARPDELTFASSGTAAAHLGVLGALAAGVRRGRGVVASAVEHSAVLAAAQAHAASAAGGSVTLAPVDVTGRVSVEEFAAALAADTALACLQAANHEVGTVQPVDLVAESCAAAGVPLLVDAAASVGHVPPPQRWDLLVASARKWGGPAGVGVLAIRTGTRWRSVLPDDEAEAGRFPGGVPVPLAVAAAAGLEAAEAGRGQEAARQSALVDRIRAEIPSRIPDVEVLGAPDPDGRLPHIVAFSCLYVAGEALMSELDRAGFSVSSGSSCSSSALTPSHVLAAMGVMTHGNVRVGLHPGVSAADVDRFLDVLPPIVARLREQVGATGL